MNMKLDYKKPELKRFGDLTPDDFDRHPVWVQCHVIDHDKPWYDETDEETFRPWEKKLPARAEEDVFPMFLVKAELILKDGTVYRGFLTPQEIKHNKDQPDLGIIQPQLFTHNGKRVSFWFGTSGNAKKEASDCLTVIGKTSNAIFPIQATALNGLSEGIVKCEIPGFLFYDKEHIFRILK